jgi:2-polyprenyl-3-methyl-5-hydroxy-6-metoxy-1,4-benzoquinol methylase
VTDPVELVRRGYDHVSYRYRGDDERPPRYAGWVDALLARLPPAAVVLDLGCGCGVPVAAALARAGHRVTGVDVSEVQVARARQLVPGGTFVHADATTVDFPAGGFDAVVCLYALIHLPLAAQPGLLARVATWLRPGGCLLATTGARAWTGTEDGWLGGSAPMWWSHADADTYRAWLTAAGLRVTAEEFVPEGASGHQLFWAVAP